MGDLAGSRGNRFPWWGPGAKPLAAGAPPSLVIRFRKIFWEKKSNFYFYGVYKKQQDQFSGMMPAHFG